MHAAARSYTKAAFLLAVLSTSLLASGTSAAGAARDFTNPERTIFSVLVPLIVLGFMAIAATRTKTKRFVATLAVALVITASLATSRAQASGTSALGSANAQLYGTGLPSERTAQRIGFWMVAVSVLAPFFFVA